MSEKTLTQQAEELGVKVDKRWGDERIQQEIDKVLAGDQGPAAAPKKAAEVPALNAYIRSKEGAKIAEGIVLVEVSHPNADAGLFQGIYSGVRTVKGELSAKFSDGSQE